MYQMLVHGGKTHACSEPSLLSCGLDITEGRCFLTSMAPPQLLLHLPNLEVSSTICINKNVLPHDSAGNRSYLVKAESEDFGFRSSWPVFIPSASVLG